jgi:pSer/pThr/pTyr-binding forkhead associated (FHA) protein
MKIKIRITGLTAPDRDPQVETVEIQASYHIVGRKGAGTVLDDSRCSKRHCVLYENHDGHLRLKDLGSTNGTFVNEKNTDECDLKIGDRIRIGRYELQILDFVTAAAAQRESVSTKNSAKNLKDTYEETTIPEIPFRPKGVVSAGPTDAIDFVEVNGTRARLPLSELRKEGETGSESDPSDRKQTKKQQTGGGER